MITLFALTALAAAAPIGLGAGLRDDFAETARVEGPRVVVRVPAGPVAVEGEVFAAVRPDRVEPLAQTFWQISDGALPWVWTRDRVTAAVLVGPRPAEGRVGRPFAQGGVEARLFTEHELVEGGEDPVLASSAWRPAFGPVVGLGVEGAAGPLTARLAVRGRFAWDLDGGFHPSAALVLDLLHGVGGDR